MHKDFKTRIYFSNPRQLIFWCFMLIFLFVGLIIQFETTGFSFLGMIFWIIAILLTLYGFFGQALRIDSQTQTVTFKRLFFKSRVIPFDNIKNVLHIHRNVRISLIKPTYLHYTFMILPKNMNLLLDTFRINHVKIKDVAQKPSLK
ncbi:MAG: EbsA family protein [Lactobacillus sp.]|jgi:hypothetical protein|nr:EbsA family protein [Lactobacillus sp.]